MNYQELKRNKLPRNKYGFINTNTTTIRTKFSEVGIGTASEGYNGTDSLNISLSKSTALFSAGTTYAGVNHDVTYIVGTVGRNPINTYIGNITGTIQDALTVTKHNDGTTNAYLTIDTTTNLFRDGVLTIPVYTNDLTANPDQDATYLYYSWALSKRGADGQSGAQGLKGACPRGPVKWEDQTTTRRFSNGQYNSEYYDDQNWIDIIIKDGVYYYCIESYNGSCQDEWSTVSSKWQQSSDEFKLIATNLLLAQNAFIDCLGSRGVHLLNDAGDTVVAGAVGGTGVNFFAGSNIPSSAPFRVNYDGTMTATKGKFGLLSIGRDPGNNFDTLSGTSYIYNSKYDIQLSPNEIDLIGTDMNHESEAMLSYYQEGISLHPEPETDLIGTTSVMEITTDNEWADSQILRKEPSTWTEWERNVMIGRYGSYERAVAFRNRYVFFSTGGYFSRYNDRIALETNGWLEAADFIRHNWTSGIDEAAITSGGTLAHIEVVDSLPSTVDPYTLYLIRG